MFLYRLSVLYIHINMYDERGYMCRVLSNSRNRVCLCVCVCVWGAIITSWDTKDSLTVKL